MEKTFYQVKLRDGVKKGLLQRDLVNEVVLDYFKSNPASTLAQLQQAFPLGVQKRLEIVLDEALARQQNIDKNGKSRKYYHIFDHVKLSNGSALAICNQWGIANIDGFLDHARQLGYQIGMDGEDMVNHANSAKTTQSVKPANAFDCYSSQYGKMAIMNDVLYFIHDGRIYRTPLDGTCKAEVIFDPENAGSCFDENIGLFFEESPCVLYVWSGKLYFCTSCFTNNDDIIFENGSYFSGLASFDPATSRLDFIRRDIDSLLGIVDGKAYGWDAHQNNLITVDLATRKSDESPIPDVMSAKWSEHSIDVFDGINRTYSLPEGKVENWITPTIYNGYVYTAIHGFPFAALRFPIDKPSAYQLLPYGVFYDNNPYDRGHSLIIKSNGILLMPLYDNTRCHLCALDDTTLTPIKDFIWDNNVFEGRLDKAYGLQYGDWFAFQHTEGKCESILCKFGLPKLVGKEGYDERYADMQDVINSVNTTYAIRYFYNQDDERYCSLYQIANDKIMGVWANLDACVKMQFSLA